MQTKSVIPQAKGKHERVTSARADFQHKFSCALVDENQTVIVGTLKTADMMKEHNPARATGDAGGHGVMTKLEYGAEEKGVHRVKPGQRVASSKPAIAVVTKCRKCHFINVSGCVLNVARCMTANINAVLNIRRKGIQELKAAGFIVSAHGGQLKSAGQMVAA